MKINHYLALGTVASFMVSPCFAQAAAASETKPAAKAPPIVKPTQPTRPTRAAVAAKPVKIQLITFAGGG